MGQKAALPVPRPRRTLPGVAIFLWGLNTALCGACAEEVAAVYDPERGNSLLGRAGHRATAPEPPKLTLERSRMVPDNAAVLDAYGRPLVELGGVTYRWWVSRGASNFGVGIGAIGAMSPVSDAQAAGLQQPGSYSASVLTFGWRYQVSDGSTLFADASGARRFDNDTPDRYATKVGVEWKGKTSRFGIDGGSRSLGFQLDSGYKMSLKLRRNGVGVYLRGQF